MSEDFISEQVHLLSSSIMTANTTKDHIKDTLLVKESPLTQKAETQVSSTDATSQLVRAGEKLLEPGGVVSILLCLCLLTYLVTGFVREVRKD